MIQYGSPFAPRGLRAATDDLAVHGLAGHPAAKTDAIGVHLGDVKPFGNGLAHGVCLIGDDGDTDLGRRLVCGQPLAAA